MEYNNYYSNQAGPPSNHQNGGSQLQIQPSRPHMMHVPVVSPNINRHAPQQQQQQTGLPNNHQNHHHHQHHQQQQQQQMHSQHISHNPQQQQQQLIAPQSMNHHQTYNQVQNQSHFAQNSSSPHLQNQHHQQTHLSQHHHQQQQQPHLQQQQMNHHQPQQQQQRHQQIHQQQQQQLHQHHHQQQQQQQHQQQHNQQIHMPIQPQNHHIHPQSPHSNMVSPMHIQTIPQSQKINQINRTSISTSNGPLSNHSTSQVIQNQPMQNFYNHNATTISTGSQMIQQQQHPLQHQSQNQQSLPSQHQNHRQQTVFQHSESPSSITPQLTPQPQQQQPQQQQILQQPHNLNNNPLYGQSTLACPPMLQTEARISELNRWLQMRPVHNNNSPLPNSTRDIDQWWDLFGEQFFTDDATLTIKDLGEQNSPMTIGRTLIPRFFKTYFEGGATDLFILIRNPRETQDVNKNILALYCDNACIVANTRWKMTELNPGAIIHSQGQLSLEFVYDNNISNNNSQNNNNNHLLIKSWKFHTKNCREFLDRDTLTRAGKDIKNLEPFSKAGFAMPTSQFLNHCRVMTPMQELMLQHRMNNLPPKECLRKYLSDTGKFTPEEIITKTSAPIKERRKRKPANAGAQAGGNNKKSKNNNISINDITNNTTGNTNSSSQSPPLSTNQFSLSAKDIMVVGEPTMMGCNFSDDNVRMITTMENSQYEKRLISPQQHNVTKIDSENISEANENSSNNHNSEENVSPIVITTEQSGTQTTGDCSDIHDPNNTKQIQPTTTTTATITSSEPVLVSQNQHNQAQDRDQVRLISPEDAQQFLTSNNYMIGDENNTNNNSIGMQTLDQQDCENQEFDENNKSMLPIPITTSTSPQQATTIITTTTATSPNSIATLHQQSSNLLSPPETIKHERTSESDLSDKSEISTHDQICQVDQIDQQQSNATIDSKSSMTNSSDSNSLNHNNNNHNNNNVTTNLPEDQDDTRSTSADSLKSSSKAMVTIVNTTNNVSSRSIGTTSNGLSAKQNRRRSSDRKETLREGLMRTSDFVVAMKDLKFENPSLWRITTGNNLLQQFEPKTHEGVVLYENTNQYAGWNPEIKKDYVGVDVKLTQHTRNQITVERLLLNFQNLDDSDAFYDKHFVIYLQILISTALDPKFWESIENEPKHHDYFFTSRRIIDDTTKRFKQKLSIKLKLGETALKNVEKYPNLITKSLELNNNDGNQPSCRACNTKKSTQLLTFSNRSYDLHSYKPVKLTNDFGLIDQDLNINLCDGCLELVKLYSEIHHTGWRLYNLAKDKVEIHRIKGKPINTILDECIKDEEWLSSIYADRDALWSSVDHMQ